MARLPDYFAVFGLDTTFGQPNALIPFVHAPAISLERMSTDPSEGWHTNGLPTAQLVPPAPVFPPVVGGLSGDLISARLAHSKAAVDRVRTCRSCASNDTARVSRLQPYRHGISGKRH